MKNLLKLMFAVIATIAVTGCIEKQKVTEKAVSQEPRQAVITFTFDDAPKSVATHAFSLLRDNDMLATVYLSTKFMDESGYVSWADVKAFDSRGWEIGAHTHTHANLTAIPEVGIMQELETSTKMFKDRGYAPTSFAAPLGELNPIGKKIIQQFYASQRDAWGNGGMNALPVQDVYHIKSLPLTDKMTMADINATLDRLEQEGGWLVLQFHDVRSVNTGPWSTTLLPEIVAEVRRRKLPVATVSEVLKHHSSTH